MYRPPTHHPERLMSCSRRTVTESDGRKSASDSTAENGPFLWFGVTIASRIAAGMEATIANRTKYQYSDRIARPWNETYFLRQVRIASPKPIFPPQDESRISVDPRAKSC